MIPEQKYLVIGIVIILILIDISFLIWTLPGLSSTSSVNEYEPLDIERGNGVVTNIWINGYNRLDVLKDHNVKYLFVDIGGTNPDGTFANPEFEIYRFLDYIEEYERESNYSFVLLPYSEIRSYEIDVSSEEFRENFVNSYRSLIERGFDGLLVDIEPVRHGQRESYLSLLRNLKEELPKGSIVSVYSGHHGSSHNEWEWDSSFYNQVINIADLVSAPGYDTSLTSEVDYQNHIIDQVKFLSSYHGADILLAIPTHKGYPETSAIALDAYAKEIIRHPESRIIGVTIFAEWTATESDWQNLDRYRKMLGGRLL